MGKPTREPPRMEGRFRDLTHSEWLKTLANELESAPLDEDGNFVISADFAQKNITSRIRTIAEELENATEAE